MWASSFGLAARIQEGGSAGGTQKVGGPSGMPRKWATTFVVARFRPAGKPGKRARSLEHRIMSLLPFSEAHCDRLVRLERVYVHRVEPVEPEADIPICAGVRVVVFSTLVTDT